MKAEAKRQEHVRKEGAGGEAGLRKALKALQGGGRKGRRKLPSGLTPRQQELYIGLAKAGKKMAAGPEFRRTVELLDEYRDFWVRDPLAWKPRRYNAGIQFQELMEHAFARYSMPQFLARVWRSPDTRHCGDRLHIEWYLDLGSGVPVRKLRNFPKDLTARMRHLFLGTPGGLNVHEALWRARVLGAGGGRSLADAVLRSPILEAAGRSPSSTGYGDTRFWMSLVTMFINNPLLDRAKFAPMCDYLYEMKYRTYWDNDGRPAVRAPNPDMTLKGRNPIRLLEDMEDWHRALAGVESGKGRADLRRWPACGIPEFEYAEGMKSQTLWCIREITTAAELTMEGRSLSHCAASYAASCMSGNASIWSLTKAGAKKLTVQVNPAAGCIVQARGKGNRLPDEKERKILGRWAEKAGLQSSY